MSEFAVAGFSFLGGVVLVGLAGYFAWGRRVQMKDDHETTCALRQEIVNVKFANLQADVSETKVDVKELKRGQERLIHLVKNGKEPDG